MKKILVLACVLCLLGMSAFAQFSVGGRAAFGMNWWSAVVDDNTYNVNTMSAIRVGALIDIGYLRAMIDYQFSLGGSSEGKVGGVDISGDTLDGYQEDYIVLTALGKYPIDLGGFIIWPALGLRCSLCIAYDGDGDGTSDLDGMALSDFFIGAGVGFDFEVTSGIVITPSVLMFYNLTPYHLEGDPPSGIDYNDIQLEISVGVAFGI